MTEQVVAFGADGGIVGILSVPQEHPRGPRRAVLMSNIGMHHRIGPFRIYVELARALAAAGLHVLRFDQSGMGDSRQRHDIASPTARAEADLRDAMDFVTETLGISEFVLVGLCSGVDSAHVIAAQDPRVRGAVFIDGYTYPTPGYYLRHYLIRPVQPGRWVRFVQRRLRGDRHAVDDGTAVFVREYPTRDRFRDDVTQMTRRGTALLFVYSAGVYHHLNASRQVFEILGPSADKTRIAVRTVFDADHVFTSPVRRAELVSNVTSWVAELPH